MTQDDAVVDEPLLKANYSFTFCVFFIRLIVFGFVLTVAFHSIMCSGTWAKDSRFRPASPEFKCPSLPPLSVTFKFAHRCDAPGSARRPQHPQTHSMATAEPRTIPNKSTQHAYNKHTQYLYIPYIYIPPGVWFLFLYSYIVTVQLLALQEIGLENGEI